MSEARVEGGPVSGFGILRRGKSGPFRGPWKHLALQACANLPDNCVSAEVRCILSVGPELDNGNSGLV